MTWLTWRQFRAQAIVAAAALAVVAAALAVTGPHLAHLFDSNGLASCQARGTCGNDVTAFMDQFKAAGDAVLFWLTAGLVFLAPALIGIFWGAPLIAREIEAGTFRLAWNQSITRLRWLAVKLGLVGLASMAVAALLTLMVTWWASPIDRAIALPAGRNGAPGFNQFAPALFVAHGIVPIGYAAFALALGITAGLVLRRTVPAMAVTLLLFAAVQIAVPLWVRPHLLPPRHAVTVLNPASIDGWTAGANGYMNVTAATDLPGAWLLSNQVLTPAGHTFTGPAPAACVSNSAPVSACSAALGRLGLRQQVAYQPASRFWAFQWLETGIYLALAGALGGCCALLIRRRAP